MSKLEKERGITLIALIITIIILVILAAVSIRAVTNMKVVDYAVNGAENYAKAGKAENKVLEDTTSFIDEAVEKVNKAANGTDYSAEILAEIQGEFPVDVVEETLTLSDGTKVLPLGESNTAKEYFYLCDGKIYKVTFDYIIETVSMTNIDVDTLGHNESTGKFTTAYGTFTEVEGDSWEPDECLVTNGENGKEYKIGAGWVYNSKGELLRREHGGK